MVYIDDILIHADNKEDLEQTIHQDGPSKTMGKWHVFETKEVQICKRKDQISGNDHQP